MKELKVAAVIPAYNPDEKLLNTLADLKKYGFEQIIVINDGSGEQSADVFARAKSQYGCRILSHAVNQGYGRALKTAFNEFLLYYPDYTGVVTLDADGQHAAEDALRCAQELSENPACLVMGCRNFHEEQVPWKSRMGNIITRGVFHFLCGIQISDTQTGLRGFSREFIRHLICAAGERYEFCSSILIEAKKLEIPINEVPIRTIYLENNKSSHFNPIKDSIRIYALIFRFLLSSILSFLVDISLFTVILALTAQFGLLVNTFMATYLARLGSAVFNYKINRSLVFKKGERHSVIKYAFACVIQATISYLAVYHLSSMTHISPVWVKPLVDLLLFILSFLIQREWVFRSRHKHRHSVEGSCA